MRHRWPGTHFAEADMAINDRPGPDGGIEAPDPESASQTGMPQPERGGCFNFGWGCLPVVAAVGLVLPGMLIF
jgi:hypothetical protein